MKLKLSPGRIGLSMMFLASFADLMAKLMNASRMTMAFISVLVIIGLVMFNLFPLDEKK